MSSAASNYKTCAVVFQLRVTNSPLVNVAAVKGFVRTALERQIAAEQGSGDISPLTIQLMETRIDKDRIEVFFAAEHAVVKVRS